MFGARSRRPGPISTRSTGLTRMCGAQAGVPGLGSNSALGTISESVRLVRGADGGTIAMRIEYLAAITIAAFVAGGLAVHSLASLPPPKQSPPPADPMAALLAES